MSKIKNIPNSGDDVADVCRAQSEHRGVWMGFIYDELKKGGHDAEGILRRAIRRAGITQGESHKKLCADPGNCNDFGKVFQRGGMVQRIFNAKNISHDNDNFKIEFQYCGLVTAWQKMGFDDETCALLCDIAMEIDRGTADGMGLKLSMDETIGKGGSACKVHFHT